MKNRYREKQVFLAWAVKLNDPDYPVFDMASRGPGPRLYFTRRAAETCCNSCKRNGFHRARVVAIKATYESALTMKDLPGTTKHTKQPNARKS